MLAYAEKMSEKIKKRLLMVAPRDKEEKGTLTSHS